MPRPSPICGSPGPKARSTARVATAAGSVSTACSLDRPSGILKTHERGPRCMTSENPPRGVGATSLETKPCTYRLAHSVGRCGWCRQYQHFPQACELGVVVTRSPTANGPPTMAISSWAREPSSSMTPTSSCPGMMGNCRGMCPAYMCLSLPQIPVRSIFSRMSSSPMAGRGNSRISIFPGAVITAAWTVLDMGVPLVGRLLLGKGVSGLCRVLQSARSPRGDRRVRRRCGRGDLWSCSRARG